MRGNADEKLFNSLIDQFHYLGYCHPVGEQLKYMVYARKRPIACLAWSSAPRHIGSRDRFIGWPVNMRKQNLSLIAYNSRFLILPWVRVPSLASHILGTMARILPREWTPLFYKTQNGARVGDLYMSLIHTCSLTGVNPIDYFTALQEHAAEMAQNPENWLPWNYTAALPPEPR